MAVSDILKRAKAVEAAFRVLPGIYLIGSLERGVTVYSQQTRAHNLIWALWELQKNGRRALGRVAIVGGGITGLTAAACILCRIRGVRRRLRKSVRAIVGLMPHSAGFGRALATPENLRLAS